MKILFVAEVFYPENFLINDLATELIERGHQVEVMTRQPSYPEGVVFSGYKNEAYSKECWNGITIHRFKTIEGYKTSKVKKIANYFHYVSAGKKVIQQIATGVDVVFIYQTGPLTLALPAVFARRKFCIPTLIWTFDIWPDAVYMFGFPKVFPLTTFLHFIIRKVYRNVDRILVSSKQFAPTIMEHSGVKDVEYVPNWLIASKQVESKLRLPAGKINFTFTGNVSKAQNLENVIRGFAIARLPDAVLNIVGNGSTLEAHKKLARELKVENVLFHGRLPYAEMADILNQSNVLILPLVSKAGIDKTEPLKIQNYLQAGKPIFGVINGAGRTIIEEYHLGRCAHPDRIEEIAQGFIDMAKMTPEQVAQVAVEAEKLMADRFNRKRVIDRIESIIQEVSRMVVPK